MSEKKASILQAGRPSKKASVPMASLMADKAGTVRVNFDLEREQHRRLKILAAEQETSVSDILRNLITYSLK